jgi:hypothetical protein
MALGLWIVSLAHIWQTGPLVLFGAFRTGLFAASILALVQSLIGSKGESVDLFWLGAIIWLGLVGDILFPSCISRWALGSQSLHM